MAAKTVECTVKDSKIFTNYLKKFASIDSTLLFEVDLSDQKFITKSPNEERSVVKFGELSFEEGKFETKSKEKIRIKVGIYNIQRIIKIIDQFPGEFQFIIKYDEVVTNDKTDHAALSILVKNDSLKFNEECTSLNIFKYISDDLWNNTIKKVDEVISFHFSKENIEKIRALSELDKEYKLIEFINKEGSLFVRGRSFEFLLAPTTDEKFSISFFKEQFNKIDVEESSVKMGADRASFKSEDSETEIVLSRAEGNDNYDNDDLPF